MLDKLRSFQRKNALHIDEHDEPTEPLPQEDVGAFVPTVPNSAVPPSEEDIPSPKTETHPFPHRFIETPVPASVYPVLPPKPHLPSNNYPVKPEEANSLTQRTNAQRKTLPLAVGMCFVVIQVLLLVRFSLKLLNVSSDNIWVGVVYGVSNVLVLPFHALFLQLSIPQLFTVELYTLLAVLVYGIVSRILVHTLKVLMKTR